MESMEIFTEILEDFKQSDLESLKVEMPGIRLSLKRRSDLQNTASASRNTVTTNSGDNKNASSESETIQCPLVGVFYSASSPGAEPFVREGQEVHKGDVLCIIEAMKSMNELKAPYNLKIRKICVENVEMAEFHQVLFEVEKC